MNNILNIGKSGLDAFQKRIDTISNNIANVGTIGYKRLDQTFEELLRNEIGELGTPLTDEIEAKNPRMGTGSKAGTVFRVFEQGVLAPSSNPLEIAIEGQGFFGMRDGADELILSRIGNFSVSNQGELVDHNGYRVETEDLDDLTDYDVNGIEINETGEIFAINEDGEKESVGKVILFGTLNREDLIDAGSGYYRITENAEMKESTDNNSEEYFGIVRQGYQEMSNVDIGKELVDLMIAQRAYQFNSKSVQAANEMWQMTNNLKR